MKVRVTVTLDIDQEAWALTYGLEAKDVTAIRQDVVRWVTHTITDLAAREDLLATNRHNED